MRTQASQEIRRSIAAVLRRPAPPRPLRRHSSAPTRMALSPLHQAAEARPGAHSIRANVLYVAPNRRGALPSEDELFNHAHHPEFTDAAAVDVRDARHADRELSLRTTGFQYVRMDVPPDVDYADDKSVTEKYIPTLERLVAQHLGAASVATWNHAVRTATHDGSGGGPATPKPAAYAGPAFRPHVDVAPGAAPGLFAAAAPAALRHRRATVAAGAAPRRWALVTGWRPLRTVRRDALAVADGATVRAGDLLGVAVAQRGARVTGGMLRRRAAHRWWYLREQAPQELLLLVQYDSAGAMPVVPHVAVELPGSSAEEARQSIEVRMFVVF